MDLATLISMGVNLILGVLVFVFGQKYITAKGKFAQVMELFNYLQTALADDEISAEEAQRIAELFKVIINKTLML